MVLSIFKELEIDYYQMGYIDSDNLRKFFRK